MRRVLVLRPEPGASATAARARDLGLDADAMPLFEVEPVPWQVPDSGSFDALLLTSANALRHGGEGLRSLQALPVHAVGEATAEAARAAGFRTASVGNGGVDALLEALPARTRLLHLGGEDRHPPATATLRITPVTVYRAREKAVPAVGAARGCVALVHSARAAARFAGLVEDRGTIAIAAISAQAAEAAGSGWEAVDVAESPNDDALLALAASLCDKPGAG